MNDSLNFTPYMEYSEEVGLVNFFRNVEEVVLSVFAVMKCSGMKDKDGTLLDEEDNIAIYALSGGNLWTSASRPTSKELTKVGDGYE